MEVEERRKELMALIPRWYSGYAHFLFINAFSISVIAGCMYALKDARWWEWSLVPILFVFANWFEWWIHRGPMHHRTRSLKLLYQRHTLEHHIIFTDRHMGLRSQRELFYIFFPPWFLPLILVINLPIPILLSVAVSIEAGIIFYLTVFAYYLTYEWFHFLHHVPAHTWVGRRRVVAWLRQHHTDHHDLARMEKGNFNVSFPLWDFLLGSRLDVVEQVDE